MPEASLAQSLLEAEDLHVFLVSDNVGGLNPALALTQGIHLWVFEEEEEQALKILQRKRHLFSV